MHRPADRRNVDAPERLRRCVEGHQDRGADDRRMGDGDQPAATGGQRVHPATHPVDQIDDGFAAVRCPRRIGQPDGEVRGPHAAEHITAPTTAVQIGQPVVDARLQAEEFRGLPGALLRPAERAVRDAQVDGGVDLAVPHRVERLVSGESSGRHRVGHGVRHQCQPDDLTHARLPLAPVLARPSLRSSLALAFESCGRSPAAQQPRHHRGEHHRDDRPQDELGAQRVQPELIEDVGGKIVRRLVDRRAAPASRSQRPRRRTRPR